MTKSILKYPELNTSRLKLREIEVADAEDIFNYASKPEVSRYLVWHPHKSVEDTYAYIDFTKKMFENREWIVLGIEFKENKKFVGTIDIRGWNSVHNCAEIGYVLSMDYWNKGIASEALRAVIGFCFDELEMNRVEAHCEEENTASERVMEKCGMKYEGALRQKVFIKDKYRTMKMYSILKNEYHK